jgi:hypothetical protein
VYVLNDLEQIGLAPDALRLVTAIAEIREPLAFLKALEKQPPDIQKAWDRRKRQLQIAITVGSGLELMKGRKPPLWSLRLNKGYRVHLQAPSTALEVWTAVQIGNHKEMGHG